MKQRFTLKNFVSVLGCMALVLSLGRCSPLASSMFKATHSSGGVSSLFGFIKIETHLLESSENQDVDSAELDLQLLLADDSSALSLSAEQLALFKSTGRVEVSVPSGVKTGRGYFTVQWRDGDDSVGATDFDSQVSQVDGKWILMAVPAVPDPVTALVRERLSGVTIIWNLPPLSNQETLASAK